MSDNWAIIYVRVSTKEQEGNESLSAQEKVCRDYAERTGLEVIAVEHDIASGSTLERSGLNKVRAMFNLGAASHLIVFAADRLNRDYVHSVLLARELKKVRVTIHDVTRRRTSGDIGEDNLFDSIENAFAEYERNKILGRFELGRRNKAERGAYMGNGVAPYGYKRVGEKSNVDLKPEPKEAAVVKDIFTWYVIGAGEGQLGAGQIVDRLNERRVPTPGDRLGRAKKRGFGEWNKNAIYEILRRPVYKGKAASGRYVNNDGNVRKRDESEWLYADVEATVSIELWEAAQEKLNKGRELSPRNAIHKYLLGRRIRCGKCGHTMQGTPSRTDGRLYLYYRCIGKVKHITAVRCTAPKVRAERIDALVWNWLLDEMLDKDKLNGQITRLQIDGNKKRNNIESEIMALLAARTEVEQQLQRLLDLYLVGAFAQDMLQMKRVQLEDDRAKLNERIEQLEQRQQTVIAPEVVQIVEELAAELRQKAAIADFETKRFLVDILNVETILSHDEDGGVIVDVTSEISSERLRVVMRSPAAC